DRGLSSRALSSRSDRRESLRSSPSRRASAFPPTPASPLRGRTCLSGGSPRGGLVLPSRFSWEDVERRTGSVATPKRHLTSLELPPLPFSRAPSRERGLRRRIEFLLGTSRYRRNEPRARPRRRAFRRPRQSAGSGSRRF